MSQTETSPETDRRALRFLPWLLPIVGDHATAVVLGQIMYWHQGKLRVQRQGHLWLAKSRADMCRECGITLDQYKRIVPKLQKLGLLICERGLFKNKVTPFLRLSEAGLALLHPNQVDGKPTTQSGATYAEQWVGENTSQSELVSSNALGEDHHIPITESTAENLTKTGTETLTENTTGLKPLGTQEEQVHSESQYVLTNIAAKQIQDGEEQKAKHPSSQVTALATTWKKIVASKTKGYVKHLSGTEVGQLKHVLNALGPERAMMTMVFALENWADFCHQAAAEKGVNPAVSPACWYFCKYHDVAVKMSQPVQSIAQVGMQLVAPAVVPPANHDLVSDELIAETMVQLKAVMKKKSPSTASNSTPAIKLDADCKDKNCV